MQIKRLKMLQFRAGMNGRQLLALLNYKIQFFQFNTETAAATLALQKQQQFRLFRHRCLLQNSANATSSTSPTLDLDEATAANEELAKNEEIIQEQQLEEAVKQTKPTSEQKPMQTENSKTFAYRIYPRLIPEKIHVKYQRGKSGQKFLDIGMKFEKGFNSLPKINVPEDVFGFVRAMNEVLKAAHANEKNIIEASSTNPQRRLVLHVANANGKNYDYILELFTHNKIVFVQMQKVPNEHKPEHTPRSMFLNLHKFHWMRTAIGEVFAANGEEAVQRKFGKPSSYPTWLNLDGIPLVLLKRKQLHPRPVNSTSSSHFGLVEQRRIGRPPSNSSVGYNNQYNSNRNLLPDNRRNLQSPQPQNMQQIDQRQQSQRIPQVQPQPAQPQVPPSSPSSSSPMSEQLLQLVFLQQQQLQQIQSAILGKMGEGRTTQNALAAPQQLQQNQEYVHNNQINQEYNNSYNQRVVQPAAGMQYNNARNLGQVMDYGNASMQFMDHNNNYYNRNEQSGMQYNGRNSGQPLDYGGARIAPRIASTQFENRTNNYGYDYRNAPQPAGMQYNNGRNSGQAMDNDGRMRTAPRMASPQYQEERVSNNYNNNMVRPEMQYRGEWQRNAVRNVTGIDKAASNRQSSREARNAQSKNLNKNPQQVDRKPNDCPYFSQLLDDYE